MNVIICGAGEVGGHAAEVLSVGGHNVTIVDLDAERLRSLNDTVDLRTLVGHCAHLDILLEAGVERCDLLIAATAVDEVNLLTASIAKASGTKKTIVRVHHTANFSLRGTPLATQLGIDELICPEYLTSLAIARTVRNPGSIALEEFARGRLLMQRIQVQEGVPAIGKVLAELALPGGTRIATIERGDEAFIANAASVINAGDHVTLIGESTDFDAIRKLFTKDKEKRIHIAIMGDSSMAVWLCRALKRRVFSVRLFVQNHERAVELADKLDHITVLEADPTDPTTSVDEHLEKVDAFVAATDDDERNILACAQAKRLGVALAITVVARPKYLHLFEHVGIDHAFCPRGDAVKAVRHLMDTGPIRSLATFARDIAEVYELHPSKKAKVIGHELRNIKMPAQSMIAAILRGEDAHMPRAEDQVLSGDGILVIGPRNIGGELRKLFISK